MARSVALIASSPAPSIVKTIKILFSSHDESCMSTVLRERA
jgi:hypothetical protein